MKQFGLWLDRGNTHALATQDATGQFRYAVGYLAYFHGGERSAFAARAITGENERFCHCQQGAKRSLSAFLQLATFRHVAANTEGTNKLPFLVAYGCAAHAQFQVAPIQCPYDDIGCIRAL